jgi:hypothetical protein
MNFPMTLATESDQVALGIRALMAPESPMMNLDGGERLAWLDRQPKQGSTGWVLVNAHTVTEYVMSKRSS